jgi:hypothetical protein
VKPVVFVVIWNLYFTPRKPALQPIASARQLTLLRAILHPQAPETLRRWIDNRTSVNLQDLDPGSRRLLPLLYLRRAPELPPSFADVLKRTHRESWARNQQTYATLATSLEWFSSRGIPTMLLKGVPLVELYYRDMGARPMADFDILIPDTHAPSAVAALLDPNQGAWTPSIRPSNAPYFPFFYRYRHALQLTRPGAGEFDLHWHALHGATHSGADAHFWEHRRDLNIRSQRTSCMSHTCVFFHTVAHGADANPDNIRWVVDAAIVAASPASTIDWEQFLHLATGLRLTIPVARCLRFLYEQEFAAIPAHVLKTLDHENRYRTTARERRYFAWRMSLEEPGWLPIFDSLLAAHYRATRDLPVFRRLALWPRHLQLHWKLPRLRDLAPHSIHWLIRQRLLQVSEPVDAGSTPPP